jgi:hypothetical protein
MNFRSSRERQKVHEGSFGSVQELVQAMTDYLTERNLEPKAYR